MANSNLQKVGRLMVRNGVYKDQDGKEKNRYHEIGIVLATPHHSQITIKLHANGIGEGMFANVFYDEDKRPNFIDKEDIKTEAKPADMIPEEIPF